MRRAPVRKASGAREGNAAALSGLDVAGIERAIIRGHGMDDLAPIGPRDRGSGSDLETPGAEGEVLDRSVQRVGSRHGGIGPCIRAWRRRGITASEVAAECDWNGELESVAGL